MKKILLGCVIALGLIVQPVVGLAETITTTGLQTTEEPGFVQSEDYQAPEGMNEDAVLERSASEEIDVPEEDLDLQETNQDNGAEPVLTRGLPTLSYRTHIQNIGWQNYMTNGQTSGTTGRALRLEGIQIKVDNAQVAGDIQYQTHIQDIGWQDWKANDEMSGTSGKAKRLEAIKIKLTGQLAWTYDVYYRVHAENFGWLGWTKNGEPAGTSGYGYRLESLQITLVNKGGAAPGSTATPFKKKPISVNYQTHIQNIGWQNWQTDGRMSGTSGKALRLEGIKVKVANAPVAGGIQYRTHVQNIGWQGWKANAEMSGTSGKALRLEAIQMQLTGELASRYDVYYRVHSENFGWLDWAKNGESSGTEGYGYRLEGIQVKLVEKGRPSPGRINTPFTALKFSAGVTGAEKEIARSVNVLRHSVGATPLTWNAKLHRAAKIRASETHKLFSHTRPNGTDFDTVLREVGYNYWVTGENIAMAVGMNFPNETQKGQKFFALWRGSTGHYINMVRDEFSEMGIALSNSGRDTAAVQLFGLSF